MAQATDLSTTSSMPLHSDVAPTLADTRRAFIGAIAALPIAATAPAAIAHTVDVDLITLGAQFEPLVDQYHVARDRWARLMVPAHAEYRKMVAPAEYRGNFWLHSQAMDVCCERYGVREADAALIAISEKMEELAIAINAAPVHSIAGLRAKAMVALWKIAPQHADDGEFSFARASAFQQLFTAVAEFCGLEDKVMATGYQLPDISMMDVDDVGGQEIGARQPASITIR